MVLRGKLNLPELKIEAKVVDPKESDELKKKVINVLGQLAGLSCLITDVYAENLDTNYKGQVALDLFADLVSMLYKLPTVLSYAPVAKGSYIVYSAYEYLLIYAILRHFRQLGELSLEGLMETLEKERKGLDKLFSFINSSKELVEVYEKLLNTPADTRPGFNFTSLASHLQLTSLMVWLLQPQSVDLSALRVAALLHDLGKLIDPEHHVKASEEIIDALLAKGGLCFANGLRKVRDLVAKHHDPNAQTIISEADHLAAGLDRLSGIVRKYVNEVSPKLAQCYDLTGSESYKCFESAGKEEYERASVELYKRIIAEVIDPSNLSEDERKSLKYLELAGKPTERETAKPAGEPLGYIVYVDFPGIQRFITSFPKLRDMSFASLLVDFVTSVYAFILLDSFYQSRGKTKLPLEALLSGYGGHSYIVVRKDANINKENIEEALSKEVEPLGVRLNAYVVDFAYRGYVRNYHEIWGDILAQQYKRYLVNFKEEVYSLGLHEVCEFCGVMPAVEVVSEKNAEYRLCRRCAFVRKNSDTRGFASKVSVTYSLDGKTITPNSKNYFQGDHLEYAMEFIAGDKSPEESKYVAFVKADGNRAGAIFMTSATFSDYVDRSFRLDYGIKKAFYKTVTELAKVNEDLAARILAGVLYMGGDDVMFLAPAFVAIPFAVKFFKEAERETGFTFKVGVVSVKPDHPVQFAYQAVNELMESAKIKDRNESSIAFLVFSSTLASGGVVRSEVDKYRRSFLRVSNGMKDVEDFLGLFGLDDFGKLSELYKDSKVARKLIREYLRPFEDLVNFAESNPGGFYKVLAYTIRLRSRMKEGNDRALKEAMTFLLQRADLSSKTVPLFDYYFALKTFRVGLG